MTAKSETLASYKGPVYEKTTAGQVVPYRSASSSSATAASTEAEADPTGGIAVEAGELGTGLETETTTSGKPELLVPGTTARVIDGQAAAPMSAPLAVQEIIWAANKIVGLPYVYGGGHNASFTSSGYDCSGTVSFALHGASLLKAPLDSSEFMRWGESGTGQWVTIFTNPEHAYMTVAGIRLDTSSADDPSNQQGPRWRPLRQSNAGYTVRHPDEL